jgi:hypothetical protein
MANSKPLDLKYLRKFILSGMKNKTLTKTSILRLLKNRHPIWDLVRSDNKIGLNVKLLYDKLSIPEGSCKVCGNPTGLNRAIYYDHCSDSCGNKSKNRIERSMKSRQHSKFHILNSRGEVKDRSHNFPNLRRKILSMVNGDSPDCSRMSFSRYLKRIIH